MEHFEPLALRVGSDGGPAEVTGADADFLDLGGSGDAGNGGGSGGDDGRFDAAIHVSPDKRNADGSYTKKRGRKSGNNSSTTSRSSRKSDNSASLDSLTRVLSILHLGIAAATKAPEMALEDSESEALAKATANVMDQFDIKPDPKIEALIGLMMVAGSIYGPRVYLIKERKKEERLEAR